MPGHFLLNCQADIQLPTQEATPQADTRLPKQMSDSPDPDSQLDTQLPTLPKQTAKSPSSYPKP